jgi:hypothetical protein
LLFDHDRYRLCPSRAEPSANVIRVRNVPARFVAYERFLVIALVWVDGRGAEGTTHYVRVHEDEKRRTAKRRINQISGKLQKLEASHTCMGVKLG